MFRFLVPVALLLAFHLHAAIRSTPEIPLSSAQIDVAAFDQTHARIATDGNGFLAVWGDRSPTPLSKGDILGIRLTAGAERVGTMPMQIAATEDDEDFPAIAWGVDRYLVVWQSEHAIQGRFVRSDGTLSDAFTIAQQLTFRLDYETHIAFNGRVFLVVWPTTVSEHPPGYRGAIVDLSGKALSTFVLVREWPLGQEAALVAAGGAFQFIFTVADFGQPSFPNGYPSRVFAIKIDERGQIGTRVELAPPLSPVFDVRATARGEDFVVAWTSTRNVPGAVIRTVRVTPAGAGAIDSIDADELAVQEIATDGFGFLLIYGDATRKFGKRVGAATAPFEIIGPPGESDVVDSASGVLLFRGRGRMGFEDGPAGGDLYVTTFEDRTVEPIVLAPRHQSAPDIAAAGDAKLVTWCEYVGSERRLAVMATINGKRIDTGGTTYHPSHPRVASNGTDWLIAWEDSGTVYGSRIAHDGTLIDDAPFVIATKVLLDEIAVGWDGTSYLVVFMRGYYFKGIHTTVYAARVPASGEAANEIELSIVGSNDSPAIATGPNGSLVVWKSMFELRGVLLSRSDVVTPVVFPPGYGESPSVAWSGDTFLVAAAMHDVWGRELRWLVVDVNGNVRTPFASFADLTAPFNNQVFGRETVHVEPFNDQFLLIWNDRASSYEVDGRTVDVFAAIISRKGYLIDGPSAVASTTLFDWNPSMAADGAQLVTSHAIGHPIRSTSRVFVRTIEWTPKETKRRRAVR